MELGNRIASFAPAAKLYNGLVQTMLSLPNLLTLSRIFAVPILVFLLWRPAPLDYAITFVLYCTVGATDYLDGYLARAKGQISRLGQFLDPIADKIMVAAVLIMLISSRKANPVPEIAGLHIIPALVILLREIIVSGLREFLAELRVSIPVSALAKWKTTFQMVALGALILGGALPQYPWVHLVGIVCLWAAAALTLVTGYDYLRTGLRHMAEDAPASSTSKEGAE
jgi:CDP-diacylglycerol--glycerol-3-phosphate 3-phosphatidyltransferase